MLIKIILIAALTGFLTKYVDLIEDHKLKSFKYLNIILGIIYGLLIGYMISKYSVIAPLWFGISIAALITGKINKPGHYAGFISLIIFLLFAGIGSIDWKLFVIFLIFAGLDELTNTNTLFKLVKNNYLKKIFKLRLILEIAVFITAIITGIWILWFALLSYDLVYIATSKIKNESN